MTIILPDDYHAKALLQANRVDCIPREKALRQDIRPMRIGILNIMPSAQNYEFNILHPLGLSIIQVDPVWVKLKSHNYTSSDKNHIQDLYVTYEEATSDAPLDGLIVTGAPVERIKFEEVRYWDEISEILLDAKHNCPSTLGICWGGFALAYLEGLDKFNYDKKLFGVFPARNLDTSNPITGELDDMFWCPQSRHAGLDDAQLEHAHEQGKINLLAYHPDCGYVMFETPDHRFIMNVGHPEYNAQRLAEEAKRDSQDPSVPAPANFDINNPINTWRSQRNMFFTLWLKYCYMSVSVPSPKQPHTEEARWNPYLRPQN